MHDIIFTSYNKIILLILAMSEIIGIRVIESIFD